MDTLNRFARRLTGLATVAVVCGMTTPVWAFDAVSVSGEQPTIVLSRLGTYRSGNFSNSTVEGPPAYDAERKRLYFPLKTKRRIDVLDISNPATPEREFKIELGFTSDALEGVAYNGKILAVAFQGPGKSAPGLVALLDRDGAPKGLPVVVGPQPSSIRFTRDRRKLLVAGRGEASNDYSPSRGPEPEPLDVGAVGSRVYAFVGFERLGGVMIYDISELAAPRFEQYINNRNFAVDPSSCIDVSNPPPECRDIGDLSVEGVLFIPAEQSPIAVPLLVLTRETSESLTLYRIDPAQ